jgi:hypothetical protein
VGLFVCLERNVEELTALVSCTEQVVNMESLLFNAPELLVTDPKARVLFPALPDFLTTSWSGTGSTQPREYN